MSFCNSFKITISSDDNILKQDEVYKLSELVYENIVNEIKVHGITLDTYYELQNQQLVVKKTKKVVKKRTSRSAAGTGSTGATLEEIKEKTDEGGSNHDGLSAEETKKN